MPSSVAAINRLPELSILSWQEVFRSPSDLAWWEFVFTFASKTWPAASSWTCSASGHDVRASLSRAQDWECCCQQKWEGRNWEVMTCKSVSRDRQVMELCRRNWKCWLDLKLSHLLENVIKVVQQRDICVNQSSWNWPQWPLWLCKFGLKKVKFN